MEDDDESVFFVSGETKTAGRFLALSVEIEGEEGVLVEGERDGEEWEDSGVSREAQRSACGCVVL